MIDTDIIVARRSPFDRLPPGGGDSDPAALDRLAASLDYLTLCCGEPATEECGQRRAAEAIA
jgi:hypothetical protein